VTFTPNQETQPKNIKHVFNLPSNRENSTLKQVAHNISNLIVPMHAALEVNPPHTSITDQYAKLNRQLQRLRILARLLETECTHKTEINTPVTLHCVSKNLRPYLQTPPENFHIKTSLSCLEALFIGELSSNQNTTVKHKPEPHQFMFAASPVRQLSTCQVENMIRPFSAPNIKTGVPLSITAGLKAGYKVSYCYTEDQGSILTFNR